MIGLPTGFWGKLSRDAQGRVVAWHPLEDHCADVAACCLGLLEGTVLGERLARLAGQERLRTGWAARLTVLAAMHDIGKFNLGFQNKSSDAPAHVAGHVGPIVALFDSPCGEQERLREAIQVDILEAWGDEQAALRLLLASLCHHGRPAVPDATQLSGPALWRGHMGRDPFKEIAALVDAALRWLPAATSPLAEKLPASPSFQHAFCGLVTLADWLGSDGRFFPYSEYAGQGRFHWACARARVAMQVTGLDPAMPRFLLGEDQPGFDRISQHSPRPCQATIAGLPLPGPGTLAFLEAETGSGKTEAALARYLRLFHAGAVDGLYFALPTRTSATQMHKRVIEAVKRAYGGAEARPPVVLAVPGYINVDGAEAQRLGPFDVLWNDNDHERLRFRGWAGEHAKRYLAGAIVVGTIDQALLSALAVPHSHLRAASLLRHLLVVDEVHASDAYMTRVLEEVVRFHVQAGGHALLMSATLGSSSRRRLLAAAGLDAPRLDLVEACRVPYPLVIQGNRPTGHVSEHETQPSGHRKDVAVELAAKSHAPEQVAAAAWHAAVAGAHVIVIRNLVRDCIATQQALEHTAPDCHASLLFCCQGLPAPHHSRFAREDRILLDQAIEGDFGKGRSPEGKVATATQTIQQSLDLDADLLITDLCPMDVLLQRIGRLHRHGDRPRPVGFEQPRVVVLVPDAIDLQAYIGRNGSGRGPNGLGTVYDDLCILQATWDELSRLPELSLPGMNRELVECCTHPAALEKLAAQRGKDWTMHRQRAVAGQLADSGIAGLNRVDRSVPFGDSAGQFHFGGQIKTRLGEGDRLIRFPGPMESPFGATFEVLTLAAHLTKGCGEGDECKAEVLPGLGEGAPSNRRVRFRLGSAVYVYDRLGLRPEEAEETMAEEATDA
jgi:CRISPR-associated endonuclease/helicase Cas3